MRRPKSMMVCPVCRGWVIKRDIERDPFLGTKDKYQKFECWHCGKVYHKRIRNYRTTSFKLPKDPDPDHS